MQSACSQVLCGSPHFHKRHQTAQVLRLLRLPAADMALLTTRKEDARIHVCFMGKGLLPEALQAKLEDEDGGFTHIVAFRPTGSRAPCSCHAASCTPLLQPAAYRGRLVREAHRPAVLHARRPHAGAAVAVASSWCSSYTGSGPDVWGGVLLKTCGRAPGR